MPPINPAISTPRQVSDALRTVFWSSKQRPVLSPTQADTLINKIIDECNQKLADIAIFPQETSQLTSLLLELELLKQSVASNKFQLIGFIGSGRYADIRAQGNQSWHHSILRQYEAAEILDSQGTRRLLRFNSANRSEIINPIGWTIFKRNWTPFIEDTTHAPQPHSDILPLIFNTPDLNTSRNRHTGLNPLIQQWIQLNYSRFLKENHSPHDTQKTLQLKFFRSLLNGNYHDLVEDILKAIRPYYANSHSEISATGRLATELLELAQQSVLHAAGLKPEAQPQANYVPIQVFPGEIGACDRFARLMKTKYTQEKKNLPTIYCEPSSPTYSVWQDHGYTVAPIPKDPDGSINWQALLASGRAAHVHLDNSIDEPVTNIAIKKTAHTGLLSISVSSPFPQIQIGQFEPDAIFRDESSLIGAEGANGTLVVHSSWLSNIPSVAGGGTVDSVISPTLVRYTSNATERENAGTPNLEAWLRAGIAAELTQLARPHYIQARLTKVYTRLAAFGFDGQFIFNSSTDTQQAQELLNQAGIRNKLIGNTLTVYPEFYWSKSDIETRIKPVILRIQKGRYASEPFLADPYPFNTLSHYIRSSSPRLGDIRLFVNALKTLPPHDRIRQLAIAILSVDHPEWINAKGELLPQYTREFLDLMAGTATLLPSAIEHESIGLSRPYQVYTDFPASGKSHWLVERMISIIGPMLRNTDLRELLNEAATQSILATHHVTSDTHRYIEVANGSTGAIDLAVRMAKNLLIDRTQGHPIQYRPVVFVSEAEHHSNILTWKEQGFEVIQIPLTPSFQINWAALKREMRRQSRFIMPPFMVVSVTGASNVIGTQTDLKQLAEIKASFPESIIGVDLAATAPHSPANLAETPWIDMAYRSDHKLVGGPGSNGGLIVNTKTYQEKHIPWVFRSGEHNTTALIKSAMAQTIQSDIVGWDSLHKIERHNQRLFFDNIRHHNRSKIKDIYKIELYGNPNPDLRTSITAFNLVNPRTGKRLHQHLVAQILNDFFGIQVRSGCNCAGPLGVRLLFGPNAVQTRQDELTTIVNIIESGMPLIKPGWVRADIGLLSDAERTYLFKAIEFIALHANQFLSLYEPAVNNASVANPHWFAQWRFRKTGDNRAVPPTFDQIISQSISGNRLDASPEGYQRFLATNITTLSTYFNNRFGTGKYPRSNSSRKKTKDAFSRDLTQKIRSELTRNGHLPWWKRPFLSRIVPHFRFFEI